MPLSLSELLALDMESKTRLGVRHTPGEIAQQPATWGQTAALLVEKAARIQELLAGTEHVVITGAGTSAYVGLSVEPQLRSNLTPAVSAVPTTDIVVDPAGSLPRGPLLLVSVARSGNSPESIAAVELADRLRPDTRHLVITCNAGGKLARWASGLGERGLAVVLPAATNDQGLAMTSSYSNLVAAVLALGYLDRLEAYSGMLAEASRAGAAFLAADATRIPALAELPFRRAVFLGNSELKGAAIESHLKLQEMTAGQVVCHAETSLGLRHGPMAVIDGETLVVHYLSADAYRARYEADILAEIRAKQLGMRTVVVGAAAEVEGVQADERLVVPGPALPDACRPLVHVMTAQLLGLFAALRLNLLPDTPSRAGVISRVVQGVRIHPYL